MHSSRMLTARLLPVSPSLHCVGVVSAAGEGLLRGRVCSGGVVSALGGVCSWGLSAPGGSAPGGPGVGGGVCCWSAAGGLFRGCIPACNAADPPPREQNS